MYLMVVSLTVFVGLLKVEEGAVSDSFACFEDPFPPIGLPRRASILGYMPSLIVTCYAKFG